jgi:hypothetical protein
MRLVEYEWTQGRASDDEYAAAIAGHSKTGLPPWVAKATGWIGALYDEWAEGLKSSAKLRARPDTNLNLTFLKPILTRAAQHEKSVPGLEDRLMQIAMVKHATTVDDAGTRNYCHDKERMNEVRAFAKRSDRRSRKSHIFDRIVEEIGNCDVKDSARLAGLCDVLDAAFSWSAKEAKSHSGTNLGAIVFEMLTDHVVTYGAMQGWDELHEFEVTGTDTRAVVFRHIQTMLCGAEGQASKNSMTCRLLASISSKRARELFEQLEMQGVIVLKDEDWVSDVKGHDVLSKRFRSSIVDRAKKELLKAGEYSQVGYLAALGSKGHAFPIDTEKEKTGRSTVLEEPVSWDAIERQWSTTQAWTDKQESYKHTYARVGRFQPERTEDLMTFYLRRQTWASSGSATGFKAPKVSAYGDSVEFEDVVSKVMEQWIALAHVRAESLHAGLNVDGSDADESRKLMLARMSKQMQQFVEKQGGLSKRGALELLLFEAIDLVLQGFPSSISVAAPKNEDGKTRLLLTQDTMTYVLFAYALDLIEDVFSEENKNIDHIQSTSEMWQRMTARIRNARDSAVCLRLWDYEDFNSQHSNLAMYMNITELKERWRDATGVADEIGVYKMAVTEWIAYSFNNTVIRWDATDEEISKSGMSSGVRGTSQVNVTENSSDSNIVTRSWDRLHGDGETVLNEEDKGDDMWQANKLWSVSIGLTKMARWCGYRGQDLKVLTGPGWGEYLKAIYDDEGSVSGCVFRSIAVAVVGSWQSPVYRDGPMMVASILDLSELMVRRGASKCFQKILCRAWTRYWGSVSQHVDIRVCKGWRKAHETSKKPTQVASRGDKLGSIDVAPSKQILARGGMKETRGLERIAPAFWCASRHLNCCEGSDAFDNTIDKWWGCKCEGTWTGKYRKIGKGRLQHCGSAFCHITPHLPPMPERPERVRADDKVLRQLGTAESRDYITWLTTTFPSFRQLDSGERWELEKACRQDNFAGSLPAFERARVDKLNDAADTVWAKASQVWQDYCSALVDAHPDSNTCLWVENKVSLTNKYEQELKDRCYPELEILRNAVTEGESGNAKYLLKKLLRPYPLMGISKGCPCCKSRNTSGPLLARRMSDGIDTSLVIAEQRLEEEVLLPLEVGGHRAGTTDVTKWKTSMGVLARTRLGRADAARMLIYSNTLTAACPPPVDGATASGEWLATRIATELDSILSHDAIGGVIPMAYCLSHEAYSDWLFARIITSRLSMKRIGTLPAVALDAILFASLEEILPNCSHSTGGTLVSRELLSAITSVVRSHLVERAEEWSVHWRKAQGD